MTKGVEESFAAWNVSLDTFQAFALGLSLAGHCTTNILPDALPLVNGSFSASISDWKAVQKFVPDFALQGNLSTEVVLSDKDKAQHLGLTLQIPQLAVVNKGNTIKIERLKSTIALTDILRQQKIDLQFVTDKLRFEQYAFSPRASVTGSLTETLNFIFSSQGDLSAKIQGSYQKNQVALDALDVRVQSDLVFGKNQKKSTTLGLKMTKPCRVSFGAEGLALTPLSVQLMPVGKLDAQAQMSQNKLALHLILDALHLEPLSALVDGLPKGTLYAKVDVNGSMQNPSGNFRFEARQIVQKKSKLPPLDAAMVGSIESRGRPALNVRLDVPKKTVNALGLDTLEAVFGVPLLCTDGVLALDKRASLTGSVRVLGKLANLVKLAGLEQKVRGILDAKIAIQGPVHALQLNGDVQLKDGRMEDPLYGVLLRDIKTKLTVKGRTKAGALDGDLYIESSMGDGMGGSFTLTGMSKLDLSRLNMQAKLNHLRPLRRQDVRISLSGQANVTGSAQSPDVTGKIIIDNGALQLENLETGPSGVTTLPIQKKSNTVSAHQKTPSAGIGHINLAVVTPGRFLVDGYGLFSAWRTDLLISGYLNEPKISGTVEAVKGSLDFLNKMFKLEKGTVTMAGGDVANPLIDMLMSNTSNNFTSYIKITGTAKKLKLSLTSEPPMPQDDVLAHILFGKNANELGRYEALELATAMAKVATGLGSKTDGARKVLGVDVLRVKSSEDRGSTGGLAVETGKYINDSLYVGVEQSAKGPAGIVQLEITPTLKFELRSQGTNTQGGFNWKYRY